jgi:choline-sulfatase
MRTPRRSALPCLLFSMALSGCGGESAPKGNDKDVVALVIIDTLRRDALGCYGNTEAHTPTIDGLAKEGTRFGQAISASGWTLPSVASIMTGNWPAMHKALGKNTRLTPITEDLPMASEVFAANGYTSIGFANAAFLSPLLGLDRGFDLFDHKHAYNWEIRRADETVDAALNVISQREGEKIFLLLHLFDAHLDYDPPDGFITPFIGARREPDLPISMKECLALRQGEEHTAPKPADIEYIQSAYQGEVAFVDTAIERFIGGLKELGRWDATTMVITSDHGEEFWDHGGFEHGHTLYDELVRIPLVIRAPKDITLSSHLVERQVRTIDIMPTLYNMAGIKNFPSFIGESLLPDMLGQTPARIPPAFSQGTLYGADKMSWRHEGFNLIIDRAKKGVDAIELYDLEKDPLQMNDISKTRPRLTSKYSEELSKFSLDLNKRAQTISTPEIQNMSPKKMKEYLQSIEALGYSGREEEEAEEE